MNGEHLKPETSRTTDQKCSKCEGRGEIEPGWPVGASGNLLQPYTCGHCGGTGIEHMTEPDENCITTPDGGCVGGPCMHDSLTSNELVAQINALPHPLRQYVHDLETNADPSGEKMRLIQLEENVVGLTAELERLTRELGTEKSGHLLTQGERNWALQERDRLRSALDGVMPLLKGCDCIYSDRTDMLCPCKAAHAALLNKRPI